MFSVQEFVSKFESYGDVELFEIYNNRDNYSNEAKEAFNIVVTKKGGIENLLARMAERQKLLNEADKIRKTALEFCMSGSDSTFAKGVITSEYLSPEKVNEIIDDTFFVAEQEKKDVQIKPRTIYGSILGGAVASVVSGFMWGTLLIYSEGILLVFLIAQVLICYYIIMAFTKQSKKNIVILIATIVASGLGYVMGQVILNIISH